MISRVERKLDIKKIQANVMEFKAKEEEEKKVQMEKNLLEIAEFLEVTQKEIINVSKKGQSEYKFVRYEDSFNKAYSEEIKMFFEEMGFNVDVKVNAINNYSFDNKVFFGLGSFSIARGLKYTFVISWAN